MMMMTETGEVMVVVVGEVIGLPATACTITIIIIIIIIIIITGLAIKDHCITISITR